MSTNPFTAVNELSLALLMPRIIAVSSGLALALGALLYPANAAAYHLKTTEQGAVVHWARPVVTISLSDEVKRRFSPGPARRAVNAAIEAWLEAYADVPEAPVFAFDTAPAPEPGVHTDGPTNGIYILDEWPYDPGRLAVTVSAFDPSTGRLLDTDIYLNAEYNFDDLSRGNGVRLRYDLATVLTHELGHALGLGESEDPGAAMWPSIPPGRMTREIGPDDVEGINAVYGGLVLDGTGCYAAVAGHGSTPLAWIVVSILALLVRRRS